jgi:6-phosphogluconate dehydrogenase
MPSDIAVIGLGVMGRNIALNLADRGHAVALFNRSYEKTELALNEATPNHRLTPIRELAQLEVALEKPRKVLLMLTAGSAVDSVIDQLSTILEPGDVIIDGGNSNFHDSQRRWLALKDKGLHFIGAGISGGEEGARHGPSIMPGGDIEGWPLVQPLLQSIAARTDDGEVCCQWVGEGGAGHYVKMIHNGIEYGDMQLIAESWQLMLDAGIEDEQIAQTFANWNQGVLESYLIEITADILTLKEDDGVLRVKRILDSAGQKGTGRWTAIDSLELGAPLTLITEAVYARALSSYKQERQRVALKLPRASNTLNPSPSSLISHARDALYAAKIISYTQGFMQMRQAAESYGWRLEYGNIALLWRAGCIIRSRFLGNIKNAFSQDPDLASLMLDDFFADALRNAESGWRATCQLGITLGTPMPATLAALSFYDGYRSPTLSANLLQAQRDYFGAHSYRRIDRPADDSFHTLWGGSREEIKTNG